MTDDFDALEQVVMDAFDAFDWHHAHRNGWRVARVQGDQSGYEIAFRTDAGSGLVVGNCLVPARIPEARRPAVAETIVRINYRLFLGGFDMDFADGELRFRVGVDVEGGALTQTMVQNMVSASLWACDRYYGAFMLVAHGDVTPEQAIDMVTGGEGKGQDEAETVGGDDAATGDAAQPIPDDPAAMRLAVREFLASLDATDATDDAEGADDADGPASDAASSRTETEPPIEEG